MPHLTDDEILGHLQSGQPKLQDIAFRQLYRDCYAMIESLVVKNSGSPEQAKDVFHDGVIVFFNKAKKNLEMTSSIKTYLYSICRNIWLSQLRKKKRELPLDDKFEYVDVKGDIFETLVVNERKKIIAELLGQLGGDCKKLLQLFYFNRMKMQKIKEVFNLGSEQAAKNKKSQCLKKLRQMVAQNSTYKNMLMN